MLINCVAYQDGQKLADLTVEDISDYVVRPDCFVWVALRDATDEELAKMQEEFGLHDLAVEDARHGHQRPKVEEYGDTLFIVMHTVEFTATDDLRVGEVNIFVGRNFVLSVRNRSTQNLLGVRGRAEKEPHLLKHGAGFVFYATWTRWWTAISPSSMRWKASSRASRSRSSCAARHGPTSSTCMRSSAGSWWCAMR
jgi:magnesium transporter